MSSTPMMSPLCARMNKKKEVVLNSVAEFLGIWALRGEASLSLKTKDGVTTIAFTHSLSGHPEDPLHPPPPPSPTVSSPQRRRCRRRGPARRERDGQRAVTRLPRLVLSSPPMPEYLGDARRPIVDNSYNAPVNEPNEFCPFCDREHHSFYVLVDFVKSA